MSQSQFPARIRSLPPFQGLFDAHKLETDNVDIYFASYPKGTTIEPHQHDTDNYGVITQGELILILKEREHRYYPGDWYHVPAKVVHGARFEQETSEIEFWFKEK